VFSIEAPVVSSTSGQSRGPEQPQYAGTARRGVILLLENDGSVRESLELLFKNAGYDVTAVANGEAALALVKDHGVRPDLVVADYNLPRAMNGVRTAEGLRQALSPGLPVIILTGDVRVATFT
jgi:two-component system CheB/CheR fusion protein